MSTDHDRFQTVLEELRLLIMELASRGLGGRFVLIGGQVPALEGLAQGERPFRLTTPTQVVVERPFSFEPDLLFSFEDPTPFDDGLPDALRTRGFQRASGFRWSKQTEAGAVHVDLFADDSKAAPTGTTQLPNASAALARPRSLNIHLPQGTLDVSVPDAVGFLTLKLDAFLRLRPGPSVSKDAFDMFAYVLLRSTNVVNKELTRSTRGDAVRRELAEVFGTVDAPGTLAVASFAGIMDPRERELLIADVVTAFASLLPAVTKS